MLSEEERHFAGNAFDLPGSGARVRGDIFQAAHMMLVKKLVGKDFRELLLCVDGDTGLAKLTNALFANDIMDGRVHVADIRFSKGLGNRKREQLWNEGRQNFSLEQKIYAAEVAIAEAAYGLKSEYTALVAAQLLSRYGLNYTGVRGQELAAKGFYWSYHSQAEPEKTIRLLTDREDLSFGDLAILLTRASMAPVDKYFAQARDRVRAFGRGSRPVSGKATWYKSAYYNPEMVEKIATILRFYHNYMLVESKDSGIPKKKRRTPAQKIGIARGQVRMRHLLAFR